MWDGQSDGVEVGGGGGSDKKVVVVNMNIWFEESKKDISLFFIEEDLGSNGIVSSYIVDGDLRYILLNNYYFKDLIPEEKVYVISHEIGHALGLIDLSSGVGMTSIMVEIFDSINSRISVLDILLMTEILNRDEYHFGEEYYSSVSNLCFADANIDGSDGEVCPGPGGGGSSSTSPSTLDQVVSFTGDLQNIIDAVSNNNIDYAYNEFMDLYPNEILHEINGSWILCIIWWIMAWWFQYSTNRRYCWITDSI